VNDWERLQQQNEELYLQQAMDYMAQHTQYMKDQEARQRWEDLYGDGGDGDGGGGDSMDTLFGLGVLLFIAGLLIYTLFHHIFGG
jgi:hypothetical protein